jgi:ATP-dependent Clp protease ATP-binding subunit ClpB
MTSNLGAESIQPTETEEEIQQMTQGIMQAVRSHFRPEFLNRLDDILIFHQLTPEVMKPIVDIQLKRLQKLLLDREIHLDVTEEAKVLLAEQGFNPLYGARPLQRVIQTRLQDALAEQIIEGIIQEGETVKVAVDDGNFLIGTADMDEPSPEKDQDEAEASDEGASRTEDHENGPSEADEKAE